MHARLCCQRPFRRRAVLFQARGVSYDQARQALVDSFGAEVVQDLSYDKLVSRIQQDVVTSLNNAVAEQ